MKELLDSVVEEFRDIWRNGRVATYIPELARACPDAVGLAVCDLGSGLYTAGDWNYPFTMQSVSKIVSGTCPHRLRRGCRVLQRGDGPPGRPIQLHHAT